MLVAFGIVGRQNGGRMSSSILRDFVLWLRQRYPDRMPSQMAFARRANVSQSLVNKLVNGGPHVPDIESYRNVAEAYWVEWREFLGEHPVHRDRLAAAYRWAMALGPLPSPDPELTDALNIVERVYAEGDPTKWNTTMQILRALLPPEKGRPAQAVAGGPAKRSRRRAARA
jgi:transcriptional regulator with XRE-family HTH domain